MGDRIKALMDYPDISFIGDWNIESWEQRIIEWYQEKRQELDGEVSTLKKADWQYLMLKSIAYFTFIGMKQIEFNGKMNSLKYAVGDYLENLGALKGVSRQEAAGATSTIRYSMESKRASATGIPKGSRVTAGDGIFFETESYSEIPAGQLHVDVPVKCLIAGSRGNQYGIGEINTMVDIIPYIDTVKNITLPENGKDRETDEELRERIFLAPEAYTSGGSKGAYEYYTRKYDPTIKDVLIYSPSERIVQVMAILNDNRLPGEEWIRGAEEYLSSDDIKMLTDKVVVKAPEEVEYNINFKYFLKESRRGEAEKLKIRVQEAISEYIKWQSESIGRDIVPEELVQRVMEAGAKRLEMSEPVFKVVGPFSVAKLKEETVIYGGLEDD